MRPNHRETTLLAHIYVCNLCSIWYAIGNQFDIVAGPGYIFMRKRIRGVRGPLVVTLNDFDVEKIHIQRRKRVSGGPYMWHIAIVVGILKNPKAAVHIATSQEVEPLKEV